MARLNVHDLRTPLSAMLLGMTVMRHAGPLNEEQEEYLTLCERNGNALMTTINSLLDIMHIEKRGSDALHCSTVPPKELIEAAIEQVCPLAAEKGIILEAADSASLPAVQVDFDKFVRVLVNLLGNAIKFTQDNGRVWLTAEIQTKGSKQFIRFSVRDTGIGIANPERIFDEDIHLDQQAPTRRSTGLGLTFCKRITEAHGGKISVESQPGNGSTFQVMVPAAV
jgi:signal transduction histidine kinase